MWGDIPLFMFLWRVLFLKAVRIITSLQKAHLREHNDQSKEEVQAWGIVPHDGFVAARAPGTSNSTPAATGRLQGCNNWPVAGIYEQLQLSSCQEMQGGQDSQRKVFATGHGSRQMRRGLAVSCSNFLDCLRVVARRTHGGLGCLLLQGGSFRLGSFEVLDRSFRCSNCRRQRLPLVQPRTICGIAAATQKLQQLLQHISCRHALTRGMASWTRAWMGRASPSCLALHASRRTRHNRSLPGNNPSMWGRSPSRPWACPWAWACA